MFLCECKIIYILILKRFFKQPLLYFNCLTIMETPGKSGYRDAGFQYLECSAVDPELIAVTPADFFHGRGIGFEINQQDLIISKCYKVHDTH